MLLSLWGLSLTLHSPSHYTNQKSILALTFTHTLTFKPTLGSILKVSSQMFSLPKNLQFGPHFTAYTGTHTLTQVHIQRNKPHGYKNVAAKINVPYLIINQETHALKTAGYLRAMEPIFISSKLVVFQVLCQHFCSPHSLVLLFFADSLLTCWSCFPWQPDYESHQDAYSLTLTVA